MKMKYCKGYPSCAITSVMAVALSLGITSCGEKEFRIKGNIEGGADKTLTLEKADFHGRWIAVDSVKVKGNGDFSVEAPAPSAPDIYRLALGDRFIYLPIDSTETLSVTSAAANFGGEFSVSGSEQAEQMASFEKELMKLDFNDSTSRADFKRDVYTKYLKDARGSVFSYYVLTKTVGDAPLYDIDDKSDTKYYAAVATSFEQYRPNDPHAKMLRDASLAALKRRNSEAGRKHVIEAEEISMIDLDLPDETGKNRKLSEFAGHGKRTILVVSMMNEPESPAFNKALSDLYNSTGGSVNIYNVSLDADQYAWREAARNLPWITVYDQGGVSSNLLLKYNIGTLPAFFIYDASGSLADRASDLAELRSKL